MICLAGSLAFLYSWYKLQSIAASPEAKIKLTKSSRYDTQSSPKYYMQLAYNLNVTTNDPLMG